MVKVLLAAHGAVVEAHPAPATARELRAFAARQLGLDASEVLVLTPRATVLLDGHNVEEEAVYALAPAAAPPAVSPAPPQPPKIKMEKENEEGEEKKEKKGRKR